MREKFLLYFSFCVCVCSGVTVCVWQSCATRSAFGFDEAEAWARSLKGGGSSQATAWADKVSLRSTKISDVELGKYATAHSDFENLADKLAFTINYKRLFEGKGKRSANDDLRRAMYHARMTELADLDFAMVMARCYRKNGTPHGYRQMLCASLLRNLRLCKKYGLFTKENLDKLRHGKAPRVTLGLYIGDIVAVDHILPVAHLEIFGKILVNLEMSPQTLNAKKSDQITERALQGARRLHNAGMISKRDLKNLEQRFINQYRRR